MATSGLRVLAYVKYTRRDRFIIAAALSFGFGDLLVPDIFTHLFDGVRDPSSGLLGLLDAIEIILTTPCECRSPPPCSSDQQPIDCGITVLLAGLVAMVLNLILPREDESVEENYDLENVQDDAEKGSIHKKEKADA